MHSQKRCMKVEPSEIHFTLFPFYCISPLSESRWYETAMSFMMSGGLACKRRGSAMPANQPAIQPAEPRLTKLSCDDVMGVKNLAYNYFFWVISVLPFMETLIPLMTYCKCNRVSARQGKVCSIIF